MGDNDAGQPSGTEPASPGSGTGYWFTPIPVYLIEASFDPNSPVNGPAVMLWAHLHRHYAWRKRVFPSHATLARETEQSDSAIRRQMLALREVGAIDWGANYGPKGRSSNEYALAPERPFQFDRGTVPPVTVKNERHPRVTVKNDGGVEVISERNPTVKNERVVESTDELEISLSSPASPDPQSPPAAPSSEREIDPRGDLQSSRAADAEKIATAWAHAKGIRAPKTEKAIATDAALLLAVGADVDHLCAVAAWMARRGYADLERALTHKDAPKPPGRPRDSPTAPAAFCDDCDHGLIETTDGFTPCPCQRTAA